MLEARMKIKYGYSERFSLKHVLNCSIANQGCDGGYSYLVSKFGSDTELIPKSCEQVRNYYFVSLKLLPIHKLINIYIQFLYYKYLSTSLP